MRGLTITTPFPTAKLTTLARLKSVLGVTSTTDDAVMTNAIGRASAAAEKYCGRTFVRQTYTELGPAFGGIEFLTKEAPVVALGTVTFNSNTLTDVTVGDKQQGVLYRKNGFDWTAQSFGGLAGGGKLWDVGTPIVGQEEPLWSVGYTAGFIPAGYDRESVPKLYAHSTDNSFNDSSSGFAPVSSFLKAGNVIETSGFAKTANNGRFVVSGTPTSTKIVVTATLVTGDTTTSTGTTGRTVSVQDLPLDVEQAVLETAKTYYQQRKTDSAVVEKQLGMARLRFSEQGGAGEPGLPPRAIGLLRPWVRGV